MFYPEKIKLIYRLVGAFFVDTNEVLNIAKAAGRFGMGQEVRRQLPPYVPCEHFFIRTECITNI